MEPPGQPSIMVRREDAGGSDEPWFEAALTPDLQRSVYADLELAIESVAQFATDLGFQIMVRSCAGNNRYLGCRRGRKPKATVKANAGSAYVSYTACPYSLKIAPPSEQHAGWTIKQVHTRHNHAPFPEGFDADATRRTRATKRRRLRIQDSLLDEQQPEQAGASLQAADREDLDSRLHPELRTPVSAWARGVNVQRGWNASASVARSDVSIHTAASTHSDADAASHLVTLNLADTTTTRAMANTNANAEVEQDQAEQQEDESSSLGSVRRSTGGSEERVKVDGQVALRTLLSHPPVPVHLEGHVGALDEAGARAALAWTRYLSTVLELHLSTLTSLDSTCTSATETETEMGWEVALSAVLERPPMVQTMQEAGRLDRGTTEQALGWVRQLLVLLETHLTLLAAACRLVDLRRPDARTSLEAVARMDAPRANEVLQWTQTLQAVLSRHIETLQTTWS